MNQNSAHPLKIARLLSCLLSALYLFRLTLPVYVVGDAFSVPISIACYALSVLSSIYLLCGGVLRCNATVLLFVICCGASICTAERADFAIPRYISWLIIITTVGPLFSSDLYRQFRSTSFATLQVLFIVATIASFCWWIVGLPNLGRSSFLTGVMYHSMVLSPIAAVTSIISLSKSLTKSSFTWYLLYFISAATCTLASSRSALLGLVLASLIIMILQLSKSPGMVFATATPLMFLIIFLLYSLLFNPNSQQNSIISGIAKKSLVHSREQHWEDRWDEFHSSPLLGVGFACSWEGTAGFNEDSGTVETGSSYISMLSMTGLAGFFSFLTMIMVMIYHVLKIFPVLKQEEKILYLGLAAFFFVHLGAEGYIYGSGSVFCLFFWCFLGKTYDQVLVHSAGPAAWMITHPALSRSAQMTPDRRKRTGAWS